MSEVTSYLAETSRGEFRAQELVRKLLAFREEIDTVVLALGTPKADLIAELEDPLPNSETSTTHSSLVEAMAATQLSHFGRVADEPQDERTSNLGEDRNTWADQKEPSASSETGEVGGARDLGASSSALVMDLHRYQRARSLPSVDHPPSRTRHEQFAAKVAACIIGAFAATIVMSTLLSTAEGTDSAEYVRDHSPALERMVPVGRYREIWPSGS